MIKQIFDFLQQMMAKAQQADFLAPLALRLYLVPVFLAAGINKFNGFEGTVAWFGNAEWGLGLPLPTLMAALATGTELLGAVLLLLGLGVRWISVPLMITMLVAIFAVHWHNGWQAIADASYCLFNCDDAIAAAERLDKARDILRDNGNYSWLTEQGGFVISNNGIEFGVTYFVMLLTLFFIGSGKLSLDYLISKK
ncbi:MAG: DoxX family protein [Gammaproteobacteria bacterium]|nr:DoxX family protein [Gammaproteobacteria bacterium]